MTTKSKTPAQLYQEFFVPAVFSPLADLLLELCSPRPAERALDLACGTGVVARRLAARVGAAGSVVGLDLRPGMLAVARAASVSPETDCATPTWLQGDATALDLADDSFDLVTCQQGLQFFSDKPAALGEMRRVLVDGGRVALALWQSLEQQELFFELIELENRHLEPLGVDTADAVAPFSLGDPEELRGLLEQAGFRDIAIGAHDLAVSYPDPPNFMANVEFAYAAVIPHFVEDPAAFEAYVAKISAEAAPLIARYTQGDRVTFTQRTHLALARP